MPRKIILVLLSIVLMVILFEGIRAVFNPLVRFEWLLRQSLLHETALGTNMDEVLHHIEKHADWKIRYVSHEVGFPDNSGKSVGEQSIRIYMGDYRNFVSFYLLKTDVTVFYGFDENSRLIDIRVWKTIDSL